MLARSYLYVPGDRPRWMESAVQGQADALILDLEDGVAPARKNDARAATARFLVSERQGAQLWVRVNGDDISADVAAIGGVGLTGVFVPGVDVARLAEVDEALTRLEELLGRRDPFPVVGLIETAAALDQLHEIVRGRRLMRLGIGEADLAGELGIEPDETRSEFGPIRSDIVVACAAAGLARPIGPVHLRLDDDEGLAASTRRLWRQGFRARTAIHPQQVHVIHDVLTPSADQVAHARELVAAFDAGADVGRGALRGPDGVMLDAATLRVAHEVLATVGAGRSAVTGSTDGP